MSLVDIIKQKGVRELLDEIIPPYPRSQPAGLLVPNDAGSPRLIGTAFDYLLRFELRRRHRDVAEKSWVAESALERIERLVAVEPDQRPMPLEVSYAELAVLVRDRVSAARRAVEHYSGLVRPQRRHHRSLAEHAVRLALLDPIVRARRFDAALNVPNAAVVDELCALLAIVPHERLPRGRCCLNPNFGRWSSAVGGADADLIMGSSLIDVKVVSRPMIERPMVRQLIGYLLLARRARDDGAPLPEIKTLAIYLARHGYLFQLDVGDIVRSKRVDRVATSFFEQVGDSRSALDLSAHAVLRRPGVVLRRPGVVRRLG